MCMLPCNEGEAYGREGTGCPTCEIQVQATEPHGLRGGLFLCRVERTGAISPPSRPTLSRRSGASCSQREQHSRRPTAPRAARHLCPGGRARDVRPGPDRRAVRADRRRGGHRRHRTRCHRCWEGAGIPVSREVSAHWASGKASPRPSCRACSARASRHLRADARPRRHRPRDGAGVAFDAAGHRLGRGRATTTRHFGPARHNSARRAGLRTPASGLSCPANRTMSAWTRW